MTILTNPNSAKKQDPTAPLESNDHTVTVPTVGVSDGEEGNDISKWRAIWRLVSVAGATICILVLSLAVGVACGRFYKYYLLTQHDFCPRYMSFGCSASFPFNPEETPYLLKEPLIFRRNGVGLYNFKENFELDIETRRYEMISVSYRNRRAATFIHDFDANMSAIADLSNGRCYLMALNGSHLLPPNQLFHLIHKTMHGCYPEYLGVVRQTMRVIIPPVPYRRGISCYITEYCRGHPIYKLARLDGNVSSLEIQDEAKFAVYAGKELVQYEIANYGALMRFEDAMAD